MSRPLDLARRPFVNRRPVVRLSILLWIAAGLLLAGNVYLYWEFLAGRGGVHAERRQVEEEIAVEERRIAALSEELASYDLAAQNEQVAYLNQRIEQRRFSWSRLFDELAGLLPRDVRITTLTPASEDAATRGRRGGDAFGGGRVLLRIQAEARSDEAILELVDALFADPDFERPNLLQQSATESGLIRFDLQTVYLPPAPPPGPVPAEEVLIEEPAAADPAGDPAGSERGPDATPTRLGRPASAPPELS